jgi:hypothetical protein
VKNADIRTKGMRPAPGTIGAKLLGKASNDWDDIYTGNSDFHRSASEGNVKETEFVFLIFWKGPGPDDFGLTFEEKPQSTGSSSSK